MIGFSFMGQGHLISHKRGLFESISISFLFYFEDVSIPATH